MTTVLEARKADGSLLGRCDVKCHAAKGTRCTCICGGANHAKGLQQALETMGVFAHRDEPDIKYVTRPIQRPLFTQEKDKEPR